MIKTIFFIGLLLLPPLAEGRAIEPTAKANYVQALQTANAFLWAWANRDSEAGMRLISKNLLSKYKKENKEEWFRDYMTGLSNPHHSSFELGQGRTINAKQIVFPVTLYEYYTGEQKAFQYKSEIEVIKEGDTWRINTLPITSEK